MAGPLLAQTSTIHGDDKWEGASEVVISSQPVKLGPFFFWPPGADFGPFGKNSPNHFSFMRDRLRWEGEGEALVAKRVRIYCALCAFKHNTTMAFLTK